MAMNTYPSSPDPSYSYPTRGKHQTAIMGETESSAEIRARISRFQKREFGISYKMLTPAERNTIQNFFTLQGGMERPFWYLDQSKNNESRSWKDEYVGRGGPLPMNGFVSSDNSVGMTDETAACKNGTANAMHLLPAAAIALNDAAYFLALEKFNLLTVVIGTPGNGTWTITWEYSSNASWVSCANVSDGSNGFRAAAGARNVSFTMPSNWTTASVNNLEYYALRARVSAYTSRNTSPLGSGANISSNYFDLHVVGGSNANTAIKLDGNTLTGGGGNYTFISGGGGANSDRIQLVSFPTVGQLLTSDHTGRLRIKARFNSDELEEDMRASNLVDMSVSIKEIQW